MNNLNKNIFAFMKYTNKYVYFNMCDLDYELFEKIMKAF